MKLATLVVAALLLSGTAHAKGIFCAKRNAQPVATLVKAAKFPGADGKLRPNTYDKFLHCGVSCVLKLRCGKLGAWTAGFAKEIKDAFDNVKGNSFGSGDLKANKFGLNVKAANDKQCLDACNAQYHR